MLPQSPVFVAYFGSKKLIAATVWQRFGDVGHYIEPFFGGGSVLFGAPWPSTRMETVNDLDSHCVNFWRSIKADPEAVARYADYPVSELDSEIRRKWLYERRRLARLTQHLRADPDYSIAKMAGWWAWIMSQLAFSALEIMTAKGQQCRPHLSSREGVQALSARDNLPEWFAALAERLRGVRILCGDWKRCVTPAMLKMAHPTAIFLDPPYSDKSKRATRLYAKGSVTVAHDVRRWCLEHSDDSSLRIALCGRDVEHPELEQAGWAVLAWKGPKNLATRTSPNARGRLQERIWFSPNCMREQSLFGGVS